MKSFSLFTYPFQAECLYLLPGVEPRNSCLTKAHLWKSIRPGLLSARNKSFSIVVGISLSFSRFLFFFFFFSSLAKQHLCILFLSSFVSCLSLLSISFQHLFLDIFLPFHSHFFLPGEIFCTLGSSHLLITPCLAYFSHKQSTPSLSNLLLSCISLKHLNTFLSLLLQPL